MSNLGDMVDAIKDDLVLTGSDYDSQIKNKIRTAIRTLQKRPFWFLWKTGEVTLTTGNTSVALPSDFGVLDTADLIYSGTRRKDGCGFDFLDYEKMKGRYWGVYPIPSGVPEACAERNAVLYVSHTAAASYTILLDYYRQDVALPTSDSDTSVFFDEAYDAVRSRAMALFKAESQHYEMEEKDEKRAAYFMRTLLDQHERRTGGN